MDNGTSFGASTLQENKLAQLVIDRVPSIEKLEWYLQAQKLH